MASNVPLDAKVVNLPQEKGRYITRSCQWSEFFDGKTWEIFVCSKSTGSLLLSHWFPDDLIAAQQLTLTELTERTILCCVTTLSLVQT